MKGHEKKKSIIAKTLAVMLMIGMMGNTGSVQAENTSDIDNSSYIAQDSGDPADIEAETDDQTAVEAVDVDVIEVEPVIGEAELTFSRKLFKDNTWISGQPEESKILKDGEMVSFDDQLIMEYLFAVPEEELDERSGKEYRLELPDGLRWKSAVPDTPLCLEGSAIPYATLRCKKTDGEISASLIFESNLEIKAPDGIDGAYVFLGCKLDEVKLGRPDEPEQCEIVLDSETLTILIQENQPRASSLSEKTGAYANGIFTWTIIYEPGKKEADLPLALVDEFDSAYHEYRQGSFKINDINVTDAVLQVDTTETVTTIKCIIPEEVSEKSDPVTITYETTLTDKGLASITDTKVTNKAWLTNAKGDKVGTEVTGEAMFKKVDWLLKESVGGLKEDLKGKYVEWEVTVNTNGKDLNKLILHDRMTNGQEYAEFNALDITIKAYRSGTETDETAVDFGHMINVSPNEDRFDLIFNTDKLADQYKVNYKTYISEEYFHSENYKEFINNATLEYEWMTDDGGMVGPETPPTVSKPIGVDGRLITKAGAGYDPSSHEITWKVEVNPRGLDLSGIVITDDIKAYGQTYVKDSLDAQLTDPSVDSKVEIDDDTGILTVRFENIGTKTITYTFKTTVDDPGDYAYNLTKKDYKNTVNAEAVLNNGTPGSKLTASAAGTQAITSNVLQKKAEGYDYSDNTIGWCITVNKNKMPMKSAADVLVTDILENGLSYVDGSMRVTKEDNNGNIVEFTGITDKKITTTDGKEQVVFKYDSSQELNDEIFIRFRTKAAVDEIDGFKNSTGIKISNTAVLKRTNFDDVEESAEQQIDNRILDKSGKYNKEQGTIEYSVNLNPHRIQLDDAIVRDELPEGLQIDKDTIKLYEANVDKTGGFTQGTEVNLADILTVNVLERWFEIKLPSAKKAYVLQYTTDVTDLTKPSFSNKISLKGITGGVSGSGGNAAGPGAGGGGGGGTSSPKVNLTLNKADALRPGVKLAGAVFRIYDEDGPMNDAVSDADGNVVFRYLKRGKTYIVEEITPPQGYHKLDDPVKIEIIKDTAAMPKEYTYPVPIKNEPVKGSISFVKKNDLGRVLEGAEFTLTDKTTGSTWSQAAISESDGKVTFTDIPYGVYSLKETKTPDHHVPDNKEYTLTVDKDGNVMITDPSDSAEPDKPLDEIMNVSEKAAIRIEKIDRDTRAGLKGVEFSLYSSQEELITKTATDDMGIAVFDNLEAGLDYIIRETVPKGYAAEQDCQKVTLPESGVNLTWENYRTEDVTITVEDGEDKTPLLNVLWGIWRKNLGGTWEDVKDKNPDKSVRSDKNGRIVFQDLPEGDYWIYMLERPEGYEMGGHLLEVSVEFDMQGDSIITIKNPVTGEEIKDGIIDVIPEKWVLTITKIIEGTKIPLEGAVFGVYFDEECKMLVEERISGKDGLVIFENLLETKSYWLKELKAPENYELDSNVYALDYTKADMIIGNAPKPETPINPEEPEPPIAPEKPDTKPNPPIAPEKPEIKPDPPIAPEKPDTKPDPPIVPEKPEIKPNPGLQKEALDSDSKAASAKKIHFPKTGDDVSWMWYLVIVLLTGVPVVVAVFYRIFMKKREEV